MRRAEESTSEAELAAMVRDSAPALKALEAALRNEWGTPAVRKYDTVFFELTDFRLMARLLCARGRLARLRGRPFEATEDYLLCYRFGSAIPQGGTLPHGFTGLWIRNIALDGLNAMVPQLSDSEAGALGQRLAGLAEQTPSVVQTLEWDREADLACLHDLLSSPDPLKRIAPLVTGTPTGFEPDEKEPWWRWRFRLTPKTRIMRAHETFLDARILHFKSPLPQRGARPVPPVDVITELLPEVLDEALTDSWERSEARTQLIVSTCRGKSALLQGKGIKAREFVGTDPFAGQALRLFRDEKSVYLYSVGPDLDDDGGRAPLKGDTSAAGKPDGDLLGPRLPR